MTVEETDNCIFCKIVRGDFGTEFIAESAKAVAFRDIQPSAPVHVLVVPKRHVSSLADLDSNDQSLAGELVLLAAEVARKQGIAESGYRLIANTGADGGQTVFHLHFHLLGGTKLPASLIARD
jgi:histidine triad (HIT) family protein